MSLLAQFCRQTHTERLEYCDGFISETQEYFFERSGRIFELVYDFLTTGHFHRQGEICHERLIKELDFWRIKKLFFSSQKNFRFLRIALKTDKLIYTFIKEIIYL